MYSFYLAFRFMVKRITAYLSMLSFTIGVAVLIIVTSVMSGFAADMKEKIRGTGSHMVVRKGVGKFIPDYEQLMKDISSVEHVEAVSPRITWPVLYTRTGFRGSDQLRFGILTGIDPELETETTNIEDYVEGGKVKFSYNDGTPKNPGLLVGMPPTENPQPRYFSHPENDLNRIRYKVTSSKLTGDQKNLQEIFEVVGDYSSGMYDFDRRRIYCSLEVAQRFLHTEGNVSEIAIRVDEYNDDAVLKEVKQNIYQNHLKDPVDRRGYSQRSVKTWKDQRSGLLQAVKVERSLTSILLFLVIIVAGFMLLAVLSMMVLEKQQDIGIIRSLGGTVSGVAGIFLAEGVIIGTIGSGMGVIIGYFTVTNLNFLEAVIESVTGYSVFPSDIYILEEIPYIWNLETALFIAGVSIAMSFLFSLIPAIRAARKVPIEAIRHE